VIHLSAAGFKQVTLLGQNVNSYSYRERDFTFLLREILQFTTIERIRFTSPHPKDFPESLIDLIASEERLCSQIHLPLQAGSSRILRLMNRTYSREQYTDLALRLRRRIPGLALTTDVIVGFPTETDTDFEETLAVMREIEFDSAFMFKYSERKGTPAARRFADDVPEEVKTERITQLVDLQRSISLKRNRRHLGETFLVLVEGPAKHAGQLQGRNGAGKIVVFPESGAETGEFIPVKIAEVTPNTLIGVAV
jgi:tRNA-2-methylthio-N6-dimethylallyladenosine synthase